MIYSAISHLDYLYRAAIRCCIRLAITVVAAARNRHLINRRYLCASFDMNDLRLVFYQINAKIKN